VTDSCQSFADLERHVPVIKIHRGFSRPGDMIPAQNLLNLAPVSAPDHPIQPVQNFKYSRGLGRCPMHGQRRRACVLVVFLHNS
jgi:hypothetical protein